MMLIHFMTCIWVFFASLSNYGGTWMDPDYQNLDRIDQYLASMYFVVQTITTVGYGDFSISNDTERLICIFLMWLGVLGFTAGTSFLTTLLDNYDSSNRENEEKLVMLNRVYQRYNLPLRIYERVKKSFNYQDSKLN